MCAKPPILSPAFRSREPVLLLVVVAIFSPAFSPNFASDCANNSVLAKRVRVTKKPFFIDLRFACYNANTRPCHAKCILQHVDVDTFLTKFKFSHGAVLHTFLLNIPQCECGNA